MAEDRIEGVQVTGGRLKFRTRGPAGETVDFDLPADAAVQLWQAAEGNKADLLKRADRGNVAAALRYLAELIEDNPDQAVPTAVHPEDTRVLVPVSKTQLGAWAALLGQHPVADEVTAGALVFTLAK